MGREFRVLSAPRRNGCARAARVRVLRGPGGQRRAVLRDGARRTAESSATRPMMAELYARRGATLLARDRRRARPAPRRRLRRGRASATSAAPTASSSAISAAGASSGSRTRPVSCRSSTSSPDASPPRSPHTGPPGIVHGDYRIDNTMVERSTTRPHHRGARLGDVDARRPADRRRGPRASTGATATRRRRPRDRRGSATVPGFLSRDEVMERYAERSGRDLDPLDYYVVFGATSSRSSSRASTPGSSWARRSARASSTWDRWPSSAGRERARRSRTGSSIPGFAADAGAPGARSRSRFGLDVSADVARGAGRRRASGHEPHREHAEHDRTRRRRYRAVPTGSA